MTNYSVVLEAKIIRAHGLLLQEKFGEYFNPCLLANIIGVYIFFFHSCTTKWIEISGCAHTAGRNRAKDTSWGASRTKGRSKWDIQLYSASRHG